jgi:hypothetical protein|tara:strand:- start:2599 stop:2838 length:240 start_codon:yes stop_codon:yes gene_type:complete
MSVFRAPIAISRIISPKRNALACMSALWRLGKQKSASATVLKIAMPLSGVTSSADRQPIAFKFGKDSTVALPVIEGTIA